jgi:4-hydroxythreonine-4-phosphate dehydrogenase
VRYLDLTENDYKKIETVRQSFQDFSINKPKIAVLGLNPHCGDGGVIGTEEDVILSQH